jgi:hypothetical protein
VEAIIMQAERGAPGRNAQADPEVFRKLRRRLGMTG